VGTNSLRCNSLDGATGEYLLPPLTPEERAAVARGEPQDPRQVSELQQWWQSVSQSHFAPVEGADPRTWPRPAGESSSPTTPTRRSGTPSPPC
jgi:hypothetical protein